MRKSVISQIERLNNNPERNTRPYRLYSANGRHTLCYVINGAGGLSDIPEAGSTLREIAAYLHGVEATV